MILIAVDGQGCHHLTVEISDRRYRRPEYMEALYNSIQMVFKKMKYHRGKNIITITEVDDGSTRTTKSKKQGGEKKVLEDDAPSWDSRGMDPKGVPPNIPSGEPWHFSV